MYKPLTLEKTNKEVEKMNKTLWLDFSKKSNYPKLDKNLDVDILIIGGGICGILLAYHLQKYFDKIVIVDQNKLYHNTTGHTTGKVTSQHGYIYYDLINMHSKTIAKEYYKANQLAVNYLKELITNEQIDCDMEIVNATLFAMDDNELQMLKNEEQAYQMLEIPYLKETITIGTNNYQALKIPNQIAFNVVKFLDHILAKLDEQKVSIYENTKIKKTITQLEPLAVTTEGFIIKAKQMISASHYPVYRGFNFYFTKLIPSISYVVVGKAIDTLNLDNEIFINIANPARSIRYGYKDNEKYIILAGNSRDSSKMNDFEEEINDLKQFGKDHLQITEYLYEWYTQDYQVCDLIPFIGRIKNTNIYMAAGFNKWGLSHSVLASLILTDLIVNGYVKYEDIFNPNRKLLLSKTLKYNLKMIKTYISSKLDNQIKDIEIGPNEGKIAKIDGRKYGIFKDSNHKIYLVKPTCPHMGCSLLYNNVSKTFDCPCHGSRFKYDGTCIDGPSNKSLSCFIFEGE